MSVLWAEAMKFKELVDRAPKEVADYINSYQFQLSLKILGTRIEQSLTKQQAAEKAGLKIKVYESFENGINWKATRGEYLKVLKHLRR